MGDRNAVLTRVMNQPPESTIGNYLSDSGFRCCFVEKPYLDDKTDISCVKPAPGNPSVRYLCTWRWSEKHGCNLYHIEDPSRPGVEIHSANVQYQLQGCASPGASFATFTKGSIGPNMPPQDCIGVTNSVMTLAALEADMRDEEKNQVPFYLTIQWEE